MRERKQTSQPDDSMHVTPGPVESSPALNREIQTKIGQQLRAIYDDIVDQGVPDRFVELLRDLDREAFRTEQGDKDSAE